MKMYIRIEGDDDAMGASYNVRCNAFLFSRQSFNYLKHYLDSLTVI